MSISEDQPARWDFFVSYTQADRAWAEWIAWILEEDGHTGPGAGVGFRAGQQLDPGHAGGCARARADDCRAVAGLPGVGVRDRRVGGRLGSDPAGRQRKLLVARVKECDRPGLLAGVVSVDLFGQTEAEARAGLRTMVSSAIAGRAKPAVAPGFPAGRAMPREPRFPGALPRVWKVPAA